MYPRARNGWTDSGQPLRGTAGKRCPNCGSTNYRETISREQCGACGLVCDYWGGGTNAVYEGYLQRHYAQQEREEEERRLSEERKELEWRQQQEDIENGWPTWYDD